ncbi:hypothetical protein H6F46_15980 [Limnothrix sp. FACHB-1083]|uniref:hypothetical protein n=1 Tax=unclassified Limnothrix TaxID=2632864 RepID=UPI001681931C|nr:MULTISPECIES: hypothetical protein [unclassified Limnothrix]MBD2162194.1 hypothetical protein [Limnothrix sp. FACHB-1083]MBD2193086.1 hypothetical protein [Limnothrix sp. FACHB-1088]
MLDLIWIPRVDRSGNLDLGPAAVDSARSTRDRRIPTRADNGTSLVPLASARWPPMLHFVDVCYDRRCHEFRKFCP